MELAKEKKPLFPVFYDISRDALEEASESLEKKARNVLMNFINACNGEDGMSAEDMTENTNEMTNITQDDDEFEIMENDFDALIEKVKMTITELKGGN